jgi:hypothetical protein
MRNLLAFLATALIAFLALGWYLGWYSFQRIPATAGGHQSFNIDINGSKIGSDLQKGEDKIHNMLDKSKAGAAGTVKTAASPESGGSTGLETGSPGGGGVTPR